MSAMKSKIILQYIFNSYFKFCVVRNPYDKKMVSLHNMRKNRDGINVSFNDFVRKIIVLIIIDIYK